MRSDQHRLRQRLRALEHGKGKVESVQQAIATSQQRREQRQANLPRPDFPEALPVSARRDEIKQAIAQHQVVVIAGETGSGKTTQIPKICLQLGRGVSGLIGHTQPRRLAARSVASRIAEELQSNIGEHVGYKVRFSDHVGEASYIKLMTDGMLLAEIQQDRFLDQYDTLIIDEAHERSLNIDFLLGYLKQLLPRRPDLKLIITSATIDTERFSQHFEQAPIIEVSGRTYPVEIRYQEPNEETDLAQAVVDAVDEVTRIDRGDILVFLSGEREIREVAEALRKHHLDATEVLPLFSRLSAAEQNRIFQSHRERRIVLSTNVAETSLTVPGIKYVIDTGSARISRYSFRSKVQRLPIEKISQASANQRAGRCGRVSAGVCIRLYSEEDFLTRPLFTDPEILRTNLASVILQMENLGLGDISAFPFVEPPDSRLISDGYKLLFELGAVSEQHTINKLGRKLVRLPIDPRLARMVFAAELNGCLSEVLIIITALSIQDPRERPMDMQQKADEAHSQFKHEDSDFLALVNLWNHYHAQRHHLSNNQLQKWCKKNFLSPLRMREWRDLHSQLLQQIKELKFKLNENEAEDSAVHQALLTGLLGHVACKHEAREYLGGRNIKLGIFPGSSLFKSTPKWIMAAELTETTRTYARTVARIEPEWVEAAASHLLKRSYAEPHWEKKAAKVAAYEQTTLYGLVITARRKVNFGPINAKVAREIFIQSALVAGEYQTRAPFFQHNRALIDSVLELESKSRRQDILVDDALLFQFYDERLPAEIYSGAQLEQWLKKEGQGESLLLDRDYLMQHSAQGIDHYRYPDHYQQGALSFGLSYHFEPGHAEDGVTISVPVALLNQLRPQPLAWLVRGLIEDKVIALIKGLPKALRKNFVPVPDYAHAALDAMEFGKGELSLELARQLQRIYGQTIDPALLNESSIDEHLRMNIRVVNDKGKLLAMSRDLASLQSQFSDQASASFAIALPTSDIERSEIRLWDFGELPQQIELSINEQPIPGYPALVDCEDSVAIQVFDTEAAARQAHREGLVRLYSLQMPDKVKYLRKQSPIKQQHCLHYVEVDTCEQLREDFVYAVMHQVCLEEDAIYNEADFNRELERIRSQVVAYANEMAQLLGGALQQYYELGLALYNNQSPAWAEAVSDMQEQLDNLIYSGFLTETPYRWLQHYPRYLKAIQLRLQRLQGNVDKDAQKMSEIRLHFEHYLHCFEQGVEDPGLLNEYRWLIEEFRVSQFAQELKTAVPVSAKRLQTLKQQLG